MSVLDNASTDATPEVCARWAGRFADLRVVRHARNIGGGPNFLRAVELSRGRWTWVLADDDRLDFSGCEDVVAALEDDAVDLIAVGAPGMEDWPSGRSTLRALWAEGRRVLFALTFIPSLVFRTELFSDRDMSDGYRHVELLYPQFPFLRRRLEEDAPIHVAASPIVEREGVTLPEGPLWFYLRWACNCLTIQDPADRRRAIYDTGLSRRHWAATHVQAVMLERAWFPDRVRGELVELVRVLRGAQRLVLLAAAPLTLAPPAAFDRLWRWNRRRIGLSVDDAIHHSLEERP